MSRPSLSMVSILLIMACTPEGSSSLEQALEGAASTSEVVPPEPGQRRNLVLTTTRLAPGAAFTLTVTGANPGEQVNIARSPQGLGTGPCFGTAFLLCLDLTSPSLQGQAIADANGTATLTQTLPATLAVGADVWFQAVVSRGPSGAAWIKSTPTQVFIEGAELAVADMVAGDLIVTEVMQNPSAVADSAGEWFEVLNTTDLDMDLDGLQVTDFVADTFTVTGSVLLPAGERLVFGRSADLASNGGVPVDYEYTGMDLGNGADELHLLSGVDIVDSVTWDDGQLFPDPVGASMELDRRAEDHVSNDAGANWAEATTPYGDGDLGTPGEANGELGRWFYTVDQNTDHLERVDLDTGAWETIGPLGTAFYIGALAYNPSSDTLYMVDGRGVDGLWTVDRATGAATLIGVHGITDLFSLVYDPRTDTLYGGAGGFNLGLWSLDPTTGASTYIGDPGGSLDGLTYDATRERLVTINSGTGRLLELDPTTASTTLIANQPSINNCGLGYDVVGDLFWALDASGDLYSYDPAAGYARTTELLTFNSYGGFVHVPFAE